MGLYDVILHKDDFGNKMNNEELKYRYQFKPWYIRLWRRRWYAIIPYWTLRAWLNSNNHEFDFRTLWGISTGMAQSKMGWYYTMEEVKARLEKRKAEWNANK